MRNVFKIFIILGITALLFSSCKVTTYTKNIRKMDIVFDSLSRKDFTLVKGLTAEATVEREKTGGLKKKYLKNYKQGEADEAGRDSWFKVKFKVERVQAKAKNRGEALALQALAMLQNKDKEVGKPEPLWSFQYGEWKFSSELVPIRDGSADFASYALIEKYPDIDYFVNVRLDKVSVKSSTGELITVKIKADGLELRTDK